jgi:hypothetical protein
LGEFQTPTVFDGVFDNWPAREWTPDAMVSFPYFCRVVALRTQQLK